ncbi:hypothetical protein F4810DRAFT_88692 [Camillea tinctor]|nr:hypothetical protein F4810DRAFT_88692 [Camillea tinctor]
MSFILYPFPIPHFIYSVLTCVLLPTYLCPTCAAIQNYHLLVSLHSTSNHHSIIHKYAHLRIPHRYHSSHNTSAFFSFLKTVKADTDYNRTPARKEKLHRKPLHCSSHCVYSQSADSRYLIIAAVIRCPFIATVVFISSIVDAPPKPIHLADSKARNKNIKNTQEPYFLSSYLHPTIFCLILFPYMVPKIDVEIYRQVGR